MKCLLYLEIDILNFNRPSFSPGECSGASSRKIGGHCNNLIMGMSESHGNNSQQFADVTHETQDAAARGGKLDIQQIEIINENKQLLFDGIGDRYLKVSGGSMFFSHSHDNILIYLTLKVFDLQKEIVRQAGCSLQHPPISLRHCTGGGTADITTASVWLPGAWSGQGPGLPCNIIYSRRRQLAPVAHTLPHIATIATQRNVASTLPQWDHSRKTIFWFWTMIRTSELLCTDHLSLLHVKIFATLDSKSFLYIYLNFTKQIGHRLYLCMHCMHQIQLFNFQIRYIWFSTNLCIHVTRAQIKVFILILKVEVISVNFWSFNENIPTFNQGQNCIENFFMISKWAIKGRILFIIYILLLNNEI